MHPMNRIILTTLSGIVLAILVSTTSVHGQTKGASVQGTITDESSALIPGVTVTATNRYTGASYSTISDTNGKYAFSALAAGDYVLSAFLQGFLANEVRKPIDKDSVVQQNFVLKIGLAAAAIQIVPLPDPPNDQGIVFHPNGNYR
jgi:hypothetical protein